VFVQDEQPYQECGGNDGGKRSGKAWVRAAVCINRASTNGELRSLPLHKIAMSGIEFVSLAVGLLPVVVEAVRGYRRTCDAVRTFRTVSTAIHRVQSMLLVQRKWFLTEIHLILSLTKTRECDISSMLQDSAHPLWYSDAFNTHFADLLGDHYEACEVIVKSIRNLLQELKEKIDRLAPCSGPSTVQLPSTCAPRVISYLLNTIRRVFANASPLFSERAKSRRISTN